MKYLSSKHSSGVWVSLSWLAIIALLLLPSFAARSTWNLLPSSQYLSAMDFLPTGLGLVGVAGPGPTLQMWDAKGNQNGVLITAGQADQVTSVKIVDSTTAWATVANEGIYLSTQNWKLTTWREVYTANNLRLLYASKFIVFILNGRALQYSTDHSTFQPTSGIAAADSVTAMDYAGGGIFIATAGNHVYRSTNSGLNWSIAVDTMRDANSVFADTLNGVIYVGGDSIHISTNQGATWNPVTNVNFAISGQVVGSYDCTGAVYATSYFTTDSTKIVWEDHSIMLRSEDFGRSWQQVGLSPGSLHYQLGRTFDRGSLFYWLDAKSMTLWKSKNGCNGSVDSSMIRYLQVRPDTGISNDLCTHTPTNFNIGVTSLSCVPLHIDAMQQLSGSGSLRFITYKGSVSVASSATLGLTYQAKTVGIDTLVCTFTFHNTITQVQQTDTIRLLARGTSDPAELSLNTGGLNFGDVKVGTTKSLEILVKNTGCAALVVDSIVSTNPALFVLDQNTFPITLPAGDTVKCNVTFEPSIVSPEDEAVEIGTSAGHEWVNLSGTGTSVAGVSTASPQSDLGFYPNPSNGLIHLFSPTGLSTISVTDCLGRIVHTEQAGFATSVDLDLRGLPAGMYMLTSGDSHSKPILLLR